jgi:hydrogenase-4 component B
LVLPAVIGALLSLLPESRSAKLASLTMCAASCMVGVSTFLVSGDFTSMGYIFPISSAIGKYCVLIDDLSALMISFSSIVFLMVVIHMIRAGEGYGMRYFGLVNILFLACVLAMCADSIILLLICWELISLATFLMSYGADETARWRYFTITHFGGLIIMVIFVAMWYLTGTSVLSEMDGMHNLAGEIVSSVMIFLLFIGFGTKLGMMPFHAWMPDLYKSSPIHTVALLSTVCSNVAILLLLKSSFLWIGIPGQTLLPLAILILASGSAIWGAMESLIQTEPRRILAYSSMENMAMVVICLAAGMLFEEMGFDVSFLVMILVTAIFHTINHSFFKSLMLLSIGTVEKSTGEHEIERMGGLAKVLPALSVFAFIGIISMAAIPPSNGFVSEWLMIKTLITAGVGDSVINIVLPLIVAVLGICGMMAAVSYARLYGFMFLGRPRSDFMTEPKHIESTTMLSLGILSCLCIALGILAIPVIDAISGGICDILGIEYSINSEIAGSLCPLALVAILSSVCIVLFVVSRLFKKRKAISATWGCGTILKDNMQCSSVGFTQPLVHVFHPIYGDSTEITDDPGKGMRVYRVRFVEPFTQYILEPIGRCVLWICNKVGRIQTGNIQSYLGYLLFTLIIVLLGARFL